MLWHLQKPLWFYYRVIVNARVPTMSFFFFLLGAVSACQCDTDAYPIPFCQGISEQTAGMLGGLLLYIPEGLAFLLKWYSAEQLVTSQSRPVHWRQLMKWNYQNRLWELGLQASSKKGSSGKQDENRVHQHTQTTTSGGGGLISKLLTSMPGFPGGPSGPGRPGSPLVPYWKETDGKFKAFQTSEERGPQLHSE